MSEQTRERTRAEIEGDEYGVQRVFDDLPFLLSQERGDHIAAQCWCDPETSDRTMDPELAMAAGKRFEAMLLHIKELTAENARLQGLTDQLKSLGHRVIGSRVQGMRDGASPLDESLYTLAAAAARSYN